MLHVIILYTLQLFRECLFSIRFLAKNDVTITVKLCYRAASDTRLQDKPLEELQKLQSVAISP